MSHTPGPWHHNGTTGDDNDAFAIWSDEGEFVASVMFPFGGDEGKPSDETRQANARLIAAAPDLLAALDSLLSTIVGFVDIEDIRADWDDSLAAYLKATGREWERST